MSFLDDILIVTKRKKADHQLALKTALNRLNEENLAISGTFACKKVEWLGFTVSAEGTRPLIKNTEALENLSAPKTLQSITA